MAKILIVPFIALLTTSGFAGDDIPLDVSIIVSTDSWKETEYRPDVAPYFRYRAIYHQSLWAEANPWLEVQKIRSDGVRSELLWSKKIDVLSNEVTSKAFYEICGKDKEPNFDCEAKIGCCKIDTIRWDKLTLSYTIYTRTHSSRDVRAFQCRADRLPYDDYTVTCKEIKGM